MKFNSKSSKLAILGMLAALSVVLMYFKISIIPSAPYLEYEAGDVPSLLAAFMFGPLAGLSVVVVFSAIQAMTVSAASGFIGFAMHVIASGVFVIVAGFMFKKFKSTIGIISGLVLGGLAMTAIMIPLNYLLIPILWPGTTQDVLKNTIIYATTPFNLMKSGLNGVLAFLLFTYTPYLRRLKKS